MTTTTATVATPTPSQTANLTDPAALRQFADRFPRAHFVLGHPDKRPVNTQRSPRSWMDIPATAAQAIAHAERGNPVGVIPSTIGMAAVDVDSGLVSIFASSHPPACTVPSRRGNGAGHAWYRLDTDDDALTANWAWELGGLGGETRIAAGFIYLWGDSAATLASTDLAGGVPWTEVAPAIPPKSQRRPSDAPPLPPLVPGDVEALATVARRLRPDAREAGAGPDARRFGKRGSLRVSGDGWYDFEAGTGGRSPVGLVMHDTGQTAAEARATLAAWGIVAPTTDFRPLNPQAEVGREIPGSLDVPWQQCEQWHLYEVPDYAGDTGVVGWGCGKCPYCRSNEHRRKHGKPYAKGVAAVVTDILVTADAPIGGGAGSPASSLANARRGFRPLARVVMLGPGFEQRIIVNGALDPAELADALAYLERQPGVRSATGEERTAPMYSELVDWQGDRPEWQRGRQRWRTYHWPDAPPPKIRGLYDFDQRRPAPEDAFEQETASAVLLRAAVAGKPPGPARAAAHRWAELVVVAGYRERGAELPQAWRKAVTDAVGRLPCLVGDCDCAASGHPRHVAAARRCWTPAMLSAAEYLGSPRPCQQCGTPYATAPGTAGVCPSCQPFPVAGWQ